MTFKMGCHTIGVHVSSRVAPSNPYFDELYQKVLEITLTTCGKARSTTLSCFKVMVRMERGDILYVNVVILYGIYVVYYYSLKV